MSIRHAGHRMREVYRQPPPITTVNTGLESEAGPMYFFAITAAFVAGIGLGVAAAAVYYRSRSRRTDHIEREVERTAYWRGQDDLAKDLLTR